MSINYKSIYKLSRSNILQITSLSFSYFSFQIGSSYNTLPLFTRQLTPLLLGNKNVTFALFIHKFQLLSSFATTISFSNLLSKFEVEQINLSNLFSNFHFFYIIKIEAILSSIRKIPSIFVLLITLLVCISKKYRKI